MENNEVYLAEKMIKTYGEKQTSKVETLKELDKKVKTPALIFAYIFGVVSTLILGTGMCLAMNVIGGTLTWMIVGVFIGVLGIILCLVNYKIYKSILNSRKKKYASQIIELSNEILNK